MRLSMFAVVVNDSRLSNEIGDPIAKGELNLLTTDMVGDMGVSWVGANDFFWPAILWLQKSKWLNYDVHRRF